MRFSVAMAALFAAAAVAGGQTNSAPDRILSAMERIVIPAAEFREASAMDVLDFLCEASMASDPEPGSFGLIHSAPNASRTVPQFETEDGFVPDFPPLSFKAQRLPLLQTIDWICGWIGIRFSMGESGPEFFLADGRRLIRKEGPAPPPESPPPADSNDEWGFGANEFGGPGEIAPVRPDGIDWEPLARSYGATADEREAILQQMGFSTTRHKGEYAHLRDAARRSADFHPMDYVQGERREGETLWTVRIFIDENGRAGGLAIHPFPGW